VQAAAGNLYSKGWDALTFTAELSKTVQMFTNLRKSLIRLLRHGDVAKTWLEYRYGWRTLYFDMVDVSKALADLEAKRTRFKERAGYSYRTVSVTNSSYSDSVNSWLCSRTLYTNISVRGSIVADINPPRFQFNPITTTWELITFSFIIDWFIGVGQWLNALSFLTLQTGYEAAGGVKIQQELLKTTYYYSFNPSFGTGFLEASSEFTSEYVVRVPTSVSLIPQVTVKLDVPKILDLWALVRGNGRGLANRR
jgi:hypothetical protein